MRFRGLAFGGEGFFELRSLRFGVSQGLKVASLGFVDIQCFDSAVEHQRPKGYSMSLQFGRFWGICGPEP